MEADVIKNGIRARGWPNSQCMDWSWRLGLY